MATNNSINLTSAGVVSYNGTGTFTGSTLTQYDVLVGGASNAISSVGPGSSGQILQSGGNASNPTYSTSTYPSTNAVSTLLYASSVNVMSALATANSAQLVTNSTGVPAWSGTLTNGQLIIGSTSATPTAGTLTAGSGITITNGAASITISASSSGFSWTDVTGATQTIVAENGYITDRSGGVTYTLPATASLGDTFKIVGKLGITTITPLALQQLLIGSASGTVGITGTAVSTNVGDCITFVCTTSGSSTVWRAEHFVGNWTLT